MLPLPTPESGGSLRELRTFLNVEDSTWPLVVAWLVAALRPRGPYPVLALFGEQGSAKSTTGRLLRDLVDPNSAPLRAEPRDGRDLMIGANNSWCLAYDNLSHIPPWLSDALCRLSTGGGFLAVTAAFFFFKKHGQSGSVESEVKSNLQVLTNTALIYAKPTTLNISTTVTGRITNQIVKNRLEELRANLEERNVPISFYGKAVDQNSNEISDAQVILHVIQPRFDATKIVTDTLP